jgi:peptidoglycan hydrolase-like protein with peptidoglycan-binding domain
LQERLKSLGASIYSGAVTGRFSRETQAAVIRFQEKYAAEILAPLGLKTGTGYVGQSTKNKLNRLFES